VYRKRAPRGSASLYIRIGFFDDERRDETTQFLFVRKTRIDWQSHESLVDGEQSSGKEKRKYKREEFDRTQPL
jgi:hypothetical protein